MTFLNPNNLSDVAENSSIQILQQIKSVFVSLSMFDLDAQHSHQE